MIIVSELSSPTVAPGIVSPTLFIENAVWARLLAYARLSGSMEINGFGYVTERDGSYWLDVESDVFITKQEVSSAHVDVDASTFAKAVYQATLVGRSDDLRLQWHSHVNGSAYFSGIDTANIESYGLAGMEYFLSLVMNKRGEVSARLDVFEPVRISAALCVVLYDAVVSLADIAQDIAENVTVPAPIVRFKPPTVKRQRKRTRDSKPKELVSVGGEE